MQVACLLSLEESQLLRLREQPARVQLLQLLQLGKAIECLTAPQAAGPTLQDRTCEAGSYAGHGTAELQVDSNSNSLLNCQQPPRQK